MRMLLLRLQAPLQSWGERSKWDGRDTASMPTKSGVIGLIACCMGLKREDARIVSLHQALCVSVRADRPGELGVDFQTVKPKRLLTAEGNLRAESKSTIVSRRQYLQDAAFLVAVTAAQTALLDEIARALQHPVWAPYLGRKCCVPTAPVFLCDTCAYGSPEDAFRRERPLERADTSSGTIFAEVEDPAGGRTRPDVLANAAERRYSARNVRYETYKIEVNLNVQIAADA